MTCLLATILCLGLVRFSVSDDNIHQYMSPEEAQGFFHSESVPKYEIVNVHWSENSRKRDVSEKNKLHIRAFGKNINLWLNPRDNVLAGEDTPVYYASYSPWTPQKVEYIRRDGLMAMVGRIFEDPRTLSSFVIGKDTSGRTRVNGYIETERMIVKPLPERIAKEYRRNRRSPGLLDDVMEPFHVVFQTNRTHMRGAQQPPVNGTILGRRAMTISSRIPEFIYPEVLVIVEYSMYRAYGRDIYGLLEYLLAFWNGVDLKYRSLSSPKVRFHIAGIVLGQDEGATPYISRNRVSDVAFDSGTAMKDASYFYYEVKDAFPLDSYDIAATMTRKEFGLEGESGVLGKAWIGLACVCYDEFRIRYGITMFRDDGVFSGVFVAAHELGHLFGAQHDVNRDGCSYETGHLMSFTPWYTKNSADFSNCSTAKIDATLKEHKLDCFFNRPRTSVKTLPRLMPGRLMNYEEQCRAHGMFAPCQIDHNETCLNIRCENEDGNCSEVGVPAADGTTCGNGDQFCLHMECVKLTYNSHDDGRSP